MGCTYIKPSSVYLNLCPGSVNPKCFAKTEPEKCLTTWGLAMECTSEINKNRQLKGPKIKRDKYCQT